MIDMDFIIAENIKKEIKNKGKDIETLSKETGIYVSELRQKLNCVKPINAIELKNIATMLGVETQKLCQIPSGYISTIEFLKGKISSKEGKEAVEIADKLSDMILFHSVVRKNGKKMQSL